MHLTRMHYPCSSAVAVAGSSWVKQHALLRNIMQVKCHVVIEHGAPSILCVRWRPVKIRRMNINGLIRPSFY
jgi:hypothetical protein